MSCKTVIRRVKDQWCQLEVELRYEDGKPHRLSITGMEGRVLRREDAEEETLEYWRAFFEDSPEELGSMIARFPHQMAERLREYSNANEAGAHFVVETDGALHGMDVHREDGDDIYTCQSCGQIRETLAEWFPEVEPWFKWHLNDMNAGCEHQEALGWGRGRTVALDRSSCTPIQLAVLDELLRAEVEKKRRDFITAYLHRVQEEQLRAGKDRLSHGLGTLLKAALSKVHGGHVDIFQSILAIQPWSLELLEAEAKSPKRTLLRLTGSGYNRTEVCDTMRAVVQSLWNLGKLEFGDVEFKAQIFENSVCAPCPECGYRYGTAWLHRELPPEVAAWFEGIDSWPSGDVSSDEEEN